MQKKRNPLILIFGLSIVFFIIFMAVSSSFLLKKGGGFFAEKQASVPLFSKGKGLIGVIELKGVIMDSKKILHQLEKFDENKDIKGVVLKVNSPGGSVAPSQEIYQAVRNFKKPLVVTMGSVAASGGLYVAVAAKKVFSNPGTITGSIGVIMEFANLKKLYEWAKIERYSINTGKFKAIGAEYKDMTDDEKQLIQNLVNNVLEQFKAAIATGRKLSPEKVSEIADGRIFSGAQAKEAGLVDELGGFQDAVDWIAKEVHLDGKPRLVYADRERHNLMDLIIDSGRPGDDEEDGESHSMIKGLVSRSMAEVLGIQLAPKILEPGVYFLWRQ